jgi:hypothetical protein
LHFQRPGSGYNLPGRLVTVANDEAFTILITPTVVLLKKFLDLSLDGLLQHPLCALANHLIEQAATLKVLPEVGNFQIDLFLWNNAAESRSLVHGVSFQPS